ncbi:MAG: peptidase M10 [Flavisolibacter sp.]
MGEVEIITEEGLLLVHSHIIIYGEAADDLLAAQIREEIETMWNEPQGVVSLRQKEYLVRFHITSALHKGLTEWEVIQNINPRCNYFRIETYAQGNISFVDGLGCNTGYFKLENLYRGSTTAAHEYGHTLGLDHPTDLDIRGQGVPGIMYPRGTLVDPPYQYDPTKAAGLPGGTLHPIHRRVGQKDIRQLQLERLAFTHNRAILGDFTNIFHWPHE